MTLDPARRVAFRAGRRLELSPKEFALLECLLAAGDRVVSSEELLERVWDEEADPFTTAAKTTVRRLRAKLGEPPLIETIRESGYRIEASASAADLRAACEEALALEEHQERLIGALLTLASSEGGVERRVSVDLAGLAGRVVMMRADEPLIVAGDFNEPQFALQDGSIVTWGQELKGDRYETWSSWTFDGVSDTGERWDTAVRWFFERPDESGLRNAYWLCHGQGEMEASHVNRGSDRWFEHIFVSRQFGVDSCEYLHEWRSDGYSDHSPLLAELTYVAG